MMKALWGILGAKGFLVVLAGLTAIVGGVYGKGYFDGYQKYKQKAESVREAALLDQRALDQENHEREMALALNKQRAKYEQQNRIRQVRRPDADCSLPPDCLRWAEDVLDAATADFSGADPTPAN
jgi:hypothetical protein